MDNKKVMQPKMVKILSSEVLEILDARKDGVTMRFLVEMAIIELSKTELGKALIDQSKYVPDTEDDGNTNSTTDRSLQEAEQSNTANTDNDNKAVSGSAEADTQGTKAPPNSKEGTGYRFV